MQRSKLRLRYKKCLLRLDSPKVAEFKYEPFSTKEEIDAVDKNQNIVVLATDIQKKVYKESDAIDSADLSLAFNRRNNRAKAKWLLQVCFYFSNRIILSIRVQ